MDYTARTANHVAAGQGRRRLWLAGGRRVRAPRPAWLGAGLAVALLAFGAPASAQEPGRRSDAAARPATASVGATARVLPAINVGAIGEVGGERAARVTVDGANVAAWTANPGVPVDVRIEAVAPGDGLAPGELAAPGAAAAARVTVGAARVSPRQLESRPPATRAPTTANAPRQLESRPPATRAPTTANAPRQLESRPHAQAPVTAPREVTPRHVAVNPLAPGRVVVTLTILL